MDSETPGPPNESPADPAPWPVVSFSILRVVIIVIELFCFAVEWNYKWCRIGGLVSGSIYNMITLKRLVLLTRTRSALFPFFPSFPALLRRNCVQKTNDSYNLHAFRGNNASTRYESAIPAGDALLRSRQTSITVSGPSETHTSSWSLKLTGQKNAFWRCT